LRIFISYSSKYLKSANGCSSRSKPAPTELQAIPAYLRAVTILEPSGDLVAETVAAVEAGRPRDERLAAIERLHARRHGAGDRGGRSQARPQLRFRSKAR
jgi:hypothetical protein